MTSEIFWKASWLSSAEEEIVLADHGAGELGHPTEAEAIMLGFLVLCVHTRSRCSDLAKVRVEPTLDEAIDSDPLWSFIETSTVGCATKTGQTSKKARLSVPIVGLSRGLADVPWAASWLSLRTKANLRADRDECLQRELLADGS